MRGYTVGVYGRDIIVMPDDHGVVQFILPSGLVLPLQAVYSSRLY